MARSVTAPATENELHAQVEKWLRRKPNERQWKALAKECRVEDGLLYGGDIDKLVAYILDMTSSDEAPIKRGKHGDRWDWVRAREYAVSRVIAREMSQNRELIKFRRDLLGP